LFHTSAGQLQKIKVWHTKATQTWYLITLIVLPLRVEVNKSVASSRNFGCCKQVVARTMNKSLVTGMQKWQGTYELEIVKQTGFQLIIKLDHAATRHVA
jgi:hypothetical protein